MRSEAPSWFPTLLLLAGVAATVIGLLGVVLARRRIVFLRSLAHNADVDTKIQRARIGVGAAFAFAAYGLVLMLASWWFQ